MSIESWIDKIGYVVVFFLGFLAQWFLAHKTAKLEIKRDIQKDKRDRDSAFLLEIMSDVLRLCKACDEYSATAQPSDLPDYPQGTMGEGLVRAFREEERTASEEFNAVSSRYDETLAKMNILKMNKCIEKVEELMDTAWLSAHRKRRGKDDVVDEREVCQKIDGLKAQIMSLVTERYDQLWEACS